MSHAIPSRLFHDLNCDRWNCNVFSGPKKSEGTQIACDFWGGVRPGGEGDEAGGRGAGPDVRTDPRLSLPKNVACNSLAVIS
ncbi:hypothetical protein HMPREF1980_01088 [Actinomyces sp. oral taxon 172 str. F0311]|nr:hypothetical protein HMPREF1980_01088 [Actinomyces sp. oral taxon 172 str. F0311]